jgi:hypothetical protein
MDSDEDDKSTLTMNSNNKHEVDKRTEALAKLESAWRIGTGIAQVAFADDKRHRRKCNQIPCTRCNFVDRGSELAQITPMLPPDMRKLAHISADKVQAANGCWLASAIVDGQWGLGCIVCCARSLPGAFGRFSWTGAGAKGQLKASRLEKHHESNEHRSAVAAYFGILEAATRSPASQEMLEQLQSLQQGKAGNPHSKAQAITWCLSEALLDIDREFVKQAKTLSICRDDRAQRLLMRFTGSTSNLSVRSGVLGIGTAHREKPDADGIVAATKEVLEGFCTPRRGAPIHGDGPKHIDAISIDGELLTHLQQIIEVIAVDEEAAEVKAADIGRGRRASAMELAPITPNLKFVTRDKAHGFRRQKHKYYYSYSGYYRVCLMFNLNPC